MQINELISLLQEARANGLTHVWIAGSNGEEIPSCKVLNSELILGSVQDLSQYHEE